MKIIHLSTLTIILIIVIVAAAGCASKPQVGSVANSSSVLKLNYKWISYQSSTHKGEYGDGSDTNSTVRIDKSSDNYQGTPAILFKINVTRSGMKPNFGAGGSSPYTQQTVYNIYYDTALTNILGGTESTRMISSPDSTAQETPIDSGSSLPSSIGKIGAMVIIGNDNSFSSSVSGATPLTYEGASTVTVPSGTYSNADLYMNSGDSYWISSGIPVKIQSSTQTEELTGWG
jgi:hypothetical protein